MVSVMRGRGRRSTTAPHARKATVAHGAVLPRLLFFLIAALVLRQTRLLSGPLLSNSVPVTTPERREAVRDAMRQAWLGYKTYAFGDDELMPLSRKGDNSLCHGLGATIVDSLDTLFLMNMTAEFREAKAWCAANLRERFDASFENPSTHVSVFETTIRMLGGLLSAHYLSEQGEEGGGKQFLDLARELGKRLLPAITSPSSAMPFPKINLATGAYSSNDWFGTLSDTRYLAEASEQQQTIAPQPLPPARAHILSFLTPIYLLPNPTPHTLQVGSIQLEFSALSRETGDPTFHKSGLAVLEFLHTRYEYVGILRDDLIADAVLLILPFGLFLGISLSFAAHLLRLDALRLLLLLGLALVHTPGGLTRAFCRSTLEAMLAQGHRPLLLAWAHWGIRM